ncbi:MAG: hypothetical protein ABL860_10110, partial [Candidatus Nitrotoga sp.]
LIQRFLSVSQVQRQQVQKQQQPEFQQQVPLEFQQQGWQLAWDHRQPMTEQTKQQREQDDSFFILHIKLNITTHKIFIRCQ